MRRRDEAELAAIRDKIKPPRHNHPWWHWLIAALGALAVLKLFWVLVAREIFG